MWSIRIYTKAWNSFWNRPEGSSPGWEGYTNPQARAIAHAISDYIDQTGDADMANRTWVYDISRKDALPEIETLKIRTDPTMVFIYTSPTGVNIAAAKLIGKQITYDNVRKMFYYIQRMQWNHDGDTLYSPDFGFVGANASQMQAGGSLISFNPWNVEEKIDFDKAGFNDNIMGILLGALAVWGISEYKKKAS